MRCYRPVSRCGSAIPVVRVDLPVSKIRKCFGSSRVSQVKRASAAPRAVAEEVAASSDNSGELSSQGSFTSTAYPFTDIEKKWQTYWDENSTFRTPHEVDTSKPKYYVLDMFPYPRYTSSLLICI